jgi:hypothetical protein
MSEPTFSGSVEQQALASQIYRLMTAQGVMFASDAPIRQTLANLSGFLATQNNSDPATLATEIDAALSSNETVFIREEQNGDVTYTTSRLGFYRPRDDRNRHMFPRRLYEPENPLPIDDISVVVTTTRPALTTVEPVFISEYWQRQVGIVPTVLDTDDQLLTEIIPDELPETVIEFPTPIVHDQQPAIVEPEIVPVIAATPSVSSTMVVLPNGVQVDIRRPTADLMAQYGSTLANQLRSALDNDPLRRLVTFGNDVFPEAGVANLGKNDLRRIRDYIIETGEPLLDTQIIADVFYHQQRQNDYESFRFALNYRLSREKDFEFVGVDGARLWSVKGLPAIGSKRVKASEMGQISGYLEEGFDDSLEAQSSESIRKGKSLDFILSFFEWEYGILPFTRAMAALLPSALLHDQRTAVVRLESPQHYTTSLAELRYPTGNRGGWLAGLEAFFHEHLVPGALITLSGTDDPHTFTITYEEQPEATDRLLVFDEKKNKFAFENTTYYCSVDSDMLLSQQQHGRLRNLKALPMTDRRKSETVIEYVFEAIGDPVGSRSEPRYRTTFDKLFVSMNVLRPTSKSYLAHLLRDNDRFELDLERDHTWQYTPPPEETSEEEDNDYDYDDDDE